MSILMSFFKIHFYQNSHVKALCVQCNAMLYDFCVNVICVKNTASENKITLRIWSFTMT